MPIAEINGDTIEKTCSVCGTTVNLNATTLRLGEKVVTHKLPDLIVLPPCSFCGAIEQLVRRFGQPTGEEKKDRGTMHSALVNALAEKLIAAGKMHPDCTSEIAARGTPKHVANLKKEDERKVPLPQEVAAKKEAKEG